jgi:hypothetical protein
VHVVGEVQETPLRLLLYLPAGFGVCVMRQVLPFQSSASVAPSLDPTAVHAVAEVHETPFRLLLVAPVGLGVFWIVQVAPFQRSASVTSLPVPSAECPTAVHTVAVREGEMRVQDTADSTPFGAEPIAVCNDQPAVANFVEVPGLPSGPTQTNRDRG